MELSLERRYGLVNLSRTDNSVIRLIEHLKRNEYAANRVHTLVLSGNILQDLIFQEESDLQYIRSHSAPKPTSYLGTDTQKPSTQVAKDIDDVLGKLRNVKNFTVTWIDDPSHALDIVYPHSRAWSTFGANLETLRLVVTVPLLTLWLQQIQFLECLNDLSIVIFESFRSGGPPDTATSADPRTVLCLLSSFINQQRHLGSLDITTTWHADFSTLFSSLATFPSLAKLSLNIPFNGQHLSNTTGILRFMQNHAKTLKTFILHCGMQRRIHEDGATHNAIQICPSDAIILFPKLGNSNLQSLAIRGLFESLADLRSLTSGFSSDHPLRELTVEVNQITKEVFDLLSQSFPRLHSLHLTARALEDGVSLHSQLDRELTTGTADYSGWILHVLTIETMSPRRYRIEWDVIAPYIPNLRSFNGSGSIEIVAVN
ncbi:hypothetical protein HGRIS_002892 [Hohenbuehelia grisea]|uniref:Uncharacterized protein n=1 Tax=Hohenbuehelia grisea TaxID=104357 RepID=A0ABR3JM02_9AGAR